MYDKNNVGLYANYKAAAFLGHVTPGETFNAAPPFLRPPALQKALTSEIQAFEPETVSQFRESLTNDFVFPTMYEDFLQVPAGKRIVVNSSCAVGEGLSYGDWIPLHSLNLAQSRLRTRVAAGILAVSEEHASTVSLQNAKFFNKELQKLIGAGTDRTFLNELVDDSSTPTEMLSTTTSAGVLAGLNSMLEVVNCGAGALYLVGSVATANLLSTLGTPPFAACTPRGGEVAGIRFLVTDQLTAGTLALVNAGKIAADFRNIEIDVARSASLQMDSAPTAGAASMVNLFQSGCIGLRSRALFAFEIVEPDAIAVLTGVSGAAR